MSKLVDKIFMTGILAVIMIACIGGSSNWKNNTNLATNYVEENLIDDQYSDYTCNYRGSVTLEDNAGYRIYSIRLKSTQGNEKSLFLMESDDNKFQAYYIK